MSLSALHFTTESGHRIGRVEGNDVIDVAPAPPEGFLPHSTNWERLESAPRKTVYDVDSIQIRPPVVPRKIICIEANLQLAESQPATGDQMSISSKLPSAVVGPTAPILLPGGESHVEMFASIALIIGQRRRHRDETSLSTVGGYTAMADVIAQGTARDHSVRALRRGFDTFGPLGQRLVPAPEDWLGLVVQGKVDGESVERWRLDELALTLEDALDQFWPSISLLPGDIVALSARRPPPAKPAILHAGSLVEVSAAVSGDIVSSVRLTE